MPTPIATILALVPFVGIVAPLCWMASLSTRS
jgi:hypothetical protein